MVQLERWLVAYAERTVAAVRANVVALAGILNRDLLVAPVLIVGRGGKLGGGAVSALARDCRASCSLLRLFLVARPVQKVVSAILGSCSSCCSSAFMGASCPTFLQY